MPTRRICSPLLALAALFAGAAAALAADGPRRVVSFNLCADQLLLAHADPDQIAGLSPYASNASMSVIVAPPTAYPRLDWSAESIVAMQPDLVLVGPTDRPATRRLLAALGVRAQEVSLIDSLDDARQQIRDVARLLGHEDRGEAMLREFDAARAALRAKAIGRGTAAVIERGGFVSGARSLAAAMIAEMGFAPASSVPGEYIVQVPLEKMVVAMPDTLVAHDLPAAPDDQGALYLTHPALKKALGNGRIINLPSRYTLCGGPPLIEGLRYLARQ